MVRTLRAEVMTGIDAALWDEALRLLREKGDPQLLGALLWRSTPDGEGTTPLPTRIVYELAAIFATSNNQAEMRLEPKPISQREQAKRQSHEKIIIEMLGQLEAGQKIEDAAATAARKLGVSKRTAFAAWTRARTLLPFVGNIVGGKPRRKRPV